jgi:hypothetical protein
MQAVALVCAMVLLSGIWVDARRDSDLNEHNRQAVLGLLEDLEELQVVSSTVDSEASRRPLFINWGGMLPLQMLSPWITSKDLPGVETLGLGWRTHSPPFNAMMEAWEIDHLAPEIFLHDDLLLLTHEENAARLIEYVHVRHGIEGRIELVPMRSSWVIEGAGTRNPRLIQKRPQSGSSRANSSVDGRDETDGHGDPLLAMALQVTRGRLAERP